MTTAEAHPRVAPAAARDGLSLAPVAAMLYALGFAVMVVRLITGWIATARVSKLAQRLPDECDVFESADLSTPACIGVLRPRIVLPSSWRSWSRETLRGVMLHERAHVARRDSLVAFLAQVNCCVFWFHPLAWWLRHTLATLAEFACDTAALNGSSDRARYANVLIEMARASQRHRGRLALVGVSAEGRSQLARRIARVVDGGSERPVSTSRKLAIVTTSLVTVLGTTACRPEPPPLRENPEYVARDAEFRAAGELETSVKKMNAADIAGLEAAWKNNPEDLETLRKILIYYAPDFSGKDPRDQAAVVRARRPYILWLVEHHPDHDARMAWTAQIFPTNRDPLTDPEGYEAAKILWMAHAERPAVNARTLGNGARFLGTHDRAIAEQMLLKAQRIAPSAEWSADLGHLYALALLGSNAATPLNVVRSSSEPDRRSDFARHARATLDASTDARLLLAAGQRLALIWSGGVGREKVVLDFDAKALGMRYLTRAVELAPDLTGARRALAAAKLRGLHDKGQDDPAGLLGLISRAQADYMSAEYREYQGKDREQAQELWARSKQSAADALALAARSPQHPNSAVTMYSANVVLATHALREGNRQEAVRLMGEATKAPPSENFILPVILLDSRLVNYLLKAGERESVASFLERSAALRTHEKDRLLKDAADIRAGLMTSSYHATFARSR